MKNFFVKLVSKFSGIKKETIDEEMKEQINEDDIKIDLFEDGGQELKIIGIFALVVIGILILIGILIFIFRKSIAEKFKILGETSAEVIDEFSSKDKNIFSTITELDGSVDCSKNYNAIYKGEYLIANQKVFETITLLNGGVYTKATDVNNVSVGNYILNEKMLTLTETMYTGSSSANIQYSISDDCKTLTRSLDDGTTVILNIK